MRHLVLVVGSGRSGTSVLAKVLGELGYHLPQPEVVPDASNPRGFGEPRWLVDFHNEHLRSAGIDVTDARPSAWARASELASSDEVRDRATRWLAGEFDQTDHILLKDPRLSYFTSLWERVAGDLDADVTYLLLLRRPQDTIHSFERWYGAAASSTNRAAAWVNRQLYSELATRDRRRSYVRHDRLLSDWSSVIGQLDDVVGLPPLARANESAVRVADRLFDRDRRLSAASWSDLGVSSDVAQLADDVWSILSSVDPAGDLPTSTYADLDQLRARYGTMHRAAEAITQPSLDHSPRAHPTTTPPTDSPVASEERRGLHLRGFLRSASHLVPKRIRRLVPLGLRRTVLGTR